MATDEHTSFDGLGDIGEDIGNLPGLGFDALKLARRPVARWKMCFRFEGGEECDVVLAG